MWNEGYVSAQHLKFARRVWLDLNGQFGIGERMTAGQQVDLLFDALSECERDLDALEDGAKSSEVLFRLLEACKRHGIERDFIVAKTLCLGERLGANRKKPIAAMER